MFRKIACFLSGLALVMVAAMANAEMVSVSIKEANLRSGPGPSHPVQWKVVQGFPLEVIKRQGSWIQVRDFEKDEAWVYAQSVNQSPYVIVTGDVVNMRDTPSTNGRVVDKVEYGTVMAKVGQENGWVKVRIGNVTGWISANYVWGW